MCFHIKLTPGQFIKNFGYDAKDLQNEQEFNKKNLRQLEKTLKSKK